MQVIQDFKTRQQEINNDYHIHTIKQNQTELNQSKQSNENIMGFQNKKQEINNGNHNVTFSSKQLFIPSHIINSIITK